MSRRKRTPCRCELCLAASTPTRFLSPSLSYDRPLANLPPQRSVSLQRESAVGVTSRGGSLR